MKAELREHLNALLCKIKGHDDRRTTPVGIKAAPCVECQRCGRVGWLMP